MDKLPITVIICTLNAGKHLEELFDTVLPFVEDLFVVDSRSLDDTVDICLEHKVKIVQRPFTTPSDQCSWALRNLPIKTEWVFDMAQDERFTGTLISEIKRIFECGIPKDVDGYTVKWRLWFMGKPLHAVRDNFRLMRVSKCSVTNVSCNEHFVVPGKILPLKGILEHKDTLNLHEWYAKQNLWSSLEAIGRIRDKSEEERRTPFGTKLQRSQFFKYWLGRLPGCGFLMKWYYYIKFGAWRDGYTGWVWASLRVWVSDVIQLKMREYREFGIPENLPKARHGDFDKRILATKLQQQLLPETCN